MAPIRVRYQTIEFGDEDIHVRSLRDKLEFQDDDGVAESLGISSANWSLFGVIWDTSKVLAHMMVDYNIAGRRVLEVGCGIGLASLVLNRRGKDITATDYHPEAESFLNKNTVLNDDPLIPFTRADWYEEGDDLGRFDLIVGSDILYEAGHIDALSGFIDQHAKPTCEVIITDPGRGQHARFSKRMVALGYSHDQREVEIESETGSSTHIQVLTYLK